ncbi:uncharacterized protein LOC125939858 [Dermacentor silvarum]|uniref:uncharacterized protein LOC125939858 n=1 Tax=Dermacentor silvarum TaxID=543639 RepID=UPI002100F64E|nr:uncharacterized protein LOC125939858 [Dermacentor silvarum]
MTQRDLDVLCGVLIQMSMEELMSLKDEDIWWLPDLMGVTQPQAIRSIRRALEGFDAYETRIYLVTWFYCYLTERQILRSWCSYRLATATTPAAALTGRFILHERLETALQYPGCHTKRAATESEGVVYACVMATRPGGTLLEHDVICMCVQRSLPYLFVHAVTRCELRVSAALHFVLRKNPGEILEGHFDKLSLAFGSAREHMADVGVLFMCNAPDEESGLFSNTSVRKDLTVADEPDQRFRELQQLYAEETIVDDNTTASLLTPPDSDNSATGQDNPNFLNGNNVGVGSTSAR